MKNEFEENLESLELQYAGDINYMCENYGILESHKKAISPKLKKNVGSYATTPKMKNTESQEENMTPLNVLTVASVAGANNARSARNAHTAKTGRAASA